MGKRRPTPNLEALSPEMSDILLGKEKTKPANASAQQRPLSKEEAKRVKEQTLMKERLPRRATYDLPPGMKDQIVEVAEHHGTTASQVAAFLLARGLKQLRAGSINLDQYKEASSSIRWEYNLRIED
jgi:hypothetical protein